MGKYKISEFFIYRKRNLIGYTLVTLSLIGVLIFISLFLPGGITNSEIQSVLKSNSIYILDYWSMDVINLPYHLLQHTSFYFLGISIFSIKLPSLILAFLSAVGMILLLKQWFKINIAVLTSLIAITTSQFLFIAQNGTSDILYLFWPVWIIYVASLIPTIKKLRKFYIVILFILATLSLYTPLSIYVIIVIAAAILIHPHLRYLIKQLSRLELIGGLIITLTLISPLIYAIYKTPSLCLTLLGIPTTWPNIESNLSSLTTQYFNFANPGGTTMITPFFELGSILLIALGAYFVLINRSTAKNYLLILWIILLIPIIILNPKYTTFTFLPLVLLLASGLNGLLSHWYGLFPRNPYARIGGLIPVVILVTFLVFSGVNRYVYEYRYNPNMVSNFNKDLLLIPKSAKNIVVANKELAFYKVISKYDKSLTISTKPISDTFLATRDAKQSFTGYEIVRIITSSNMNNSDRLYIYKK
jgi:4-amino-4-deoxy-L-arabinose transferase-like glycosyltransferase